MDIIATIIIITDFDHFIFYFLKIKSPIYGWLCECNIRKKKLKNDH